MAHLIRKCETRFNIPPSVKFNNIRFESDWKTCVQQCDNNEKSCLLNRVLARSSDHEKCSFYSNLVDSFALTHNITWAGPPENSDKSGSFGGQKISRAHGSVTLRFHQSSFFVVGGLKSDMLIYFVFVWIVNVQPKSTANLNWRNCLINTALAEKRNYRTCLCLNPLANKQCAFQLDLGAKIDTKLTFLQSHKKVTISLI